MATAKGLAAGAGIPLVSVPSLEAMAFALRWTSITVVPIIDARKKRVYTAAFRMGKQIHDDVDLDLQNLTDYLSDLKPLVLTGPGVEIAALISPPSEDLFIDRENTSWNRGYIELGIERFKTNGADEPGAGPEYLRKSDAELNLKN